MVEVTVYLLEHVISYVVGSVSQRISLNSALPRRRRLSVFFSAVVLYSFARLATLSPLSTSVDIACFSSPLLSPRVCCAWVYRPLRTRQLWYQTQAARYPRVLLSPTNWQDSNKLTKRKQSTTCGRQLKGLFNDTRMMAVT